MKRRFFSAAILILSGGVAVAAPPVFHLGLKEAEVQAFVHSPQVRAAQAAADAAEARARSQLAVQGPTLSLDASYRHVSEVPAFQPVPAAPPVRLGDNKNYSIGPSVNWLIWDSGAMFNRWRSAESRSRSKADDLAWAKQQVLLETRLDYFQVQLGLEQVRLLADSLKLALSQYKDINLRHRAGTLSRIDALQAHEEVLTRRNQLRQAQSDLAAALGGLFTITGSTPPAPISIPLSARVQEDDLGDIDAASLLIDLDPLTTDLSGLAGAADAPFNAHHPRVESLSNLVRAAERNVDAALAGHGPSIQLGGRISRDYPNGPILESFTQKTFTASVSWPIFEWGRVHDEAREQKQTAVQTAAERENALDGLRREWEKAHDQWLGLVSQKKINLQAVKEAQELARLVYQSYQAGSSSYLEVETANVRALESQIVAARTDAQILIQLAMLDSMSAKE